MLSQYYKRKLRNSKYLQMLYEKATPAGNTVMVLCHFMSSGTSIGCGILHLGFQKWLPIAPFKQIPSDTTVTAISVDTGNWDTLSCKYCTLSVVCLKAT